MLAIAFSWAVWDAIGWPAVVNGLTFISRDDRRRGRGMVMGFFEAIRRSVEFILAMITVGCSGPSLSTGRSSSASRSATP